MLISSNNNNSQGSSAASAMDKLPMPKCCKLDSKECLSLSSILATFAAAINEEQAWALTYQTLQCAQTILIKKKKDFNKSSRGEKSSLSSFTAASHPDHIKIHRDGFVHPDTFLNPDLQISHCQRSDRRNSKTISECKIISKFGGAIFEALDYGLSDEDERQLSPEFDALLDTMISSDDSTSATADDEGIERDSGDSSDDDQAATRGVVLENILGICRERLGKGSNSDAHYKAVCRALVTEALELSEFLERVSRGTKQLRKPIGHNNYSTAAGRDSKTSSSNNVIIQPADFDLEQLNFAIWARLWVQVIQDLRNGVKLKETKNLKNGCRPSPVEYELTPYEILMDDIRSRRYKLKQVMVDGELPQRVKEDAHAKILEFIRSRPPLKSGADRKLGPPPVKKLHPIEALMESIKQKPNLKPTPTKVNNSLPNVSIRSTRRQSSYGEMSRSSSISDHIPKNFLNRGASQSFSTNHTVSSAARPKKLIIPDFDLLYSLDQEDGSDEESGCGGANKSNDSTGFLYYGHICPDMPQSTTPWEIISGSKMQESGNVSYVPSRVDLQRRHTICSPNRLTHKDNNNSTSFLFDCADNLAAFHSLNESNDPVFHKQKTKNSKCMIT